MCTFAFQLQVFVSNKQIIFEKREESKQKEEKYRVFVDICIVTVFVGKSCDTGLYIFLVCVFLMNACLTDM